MGIGLGDHRAASDDVESFGRSVTAQTLRPDLIGAEGFLAFVLEIADQAAPPDPKQEKLRLA